MNKIIVSVWYPTHISRKEVFESNNDQVSLDKLHQTVQEYLYFLEEEPFMENLPEYYISKWFRIDNVFYKFTSGTNNNRSFVQWINKNYDSKYPKDITIELIYNQTF